LVACQRRKSASLMTTIYCAKALINGIEAVCNGVSAATAVGFKAN